MSPKTLHRRLSGKHFSWLLPICFGALLLVASKLPDGPGNAKAGRDLFLSKGCARCHSIWSAGGKRGPALASVGMGRNLYELCASVWTHWSRMNAVLGSNEARVSLSAEQFRDIIAYLYYLNYNLEPGDAGNGEAIFKARDCLECHAANPLQAEDKPGRAVYKMSQFTDPVALAVAVWNHGNNMFASMSRRSIKWPQFQGGEVADLVAFLRTSNRPLTKMGMVIPGDPSSGQNLFRAKGCEGCHEPKINASHPGPDLASSGAAASVSSLVAGLWNHHPGMQRTFAAGGIPYPRISLQEMGDLLSYIYWLRAYGLSGNPKTGGSLYRSKDCAACHSPSAGNAAIAPLLSGSQATASPYSLLAAIWNHGPRMESLLHEKKLPWPELSGEEMRDLIAYFRSGSAAPVKK